MEQETAGTGRESGAHRQAPASEPAGKADIGKRILAAIIDAVLGGVVSFVPVVGGLAATAYWLVRDGLELEFMDGRSVGKKLMKLRPIRLDGGAMDLATSVGRNWPFAIGGVALVLAFIPIIGWLLIVPVALLAFLVGVVETVLCFTDAEGQRMGDKFAGTQVVEVDA